MRDLWDAEYSEVDRVRNVGNVTAFVLTASALWMGLGWWSAGVFVCVVMLTAGTSALVERRYDRIRIDARFREEDELWGLGWDSKKDALAHLATVPRYWRETHMVMRYFNKDQKERWGVCNKPAYWRDGAAQLKVKERFPPTAEEEKMMEGLQASLIRKARGDG